MTSDTSTRASGPAPGWLGRRRQTHWIGEGPALKGGARDAGRAARTMRGVRPCCPRAGVGQDQLVPGVIRPVALTGPSASTHPLAANAPGEGPAGGPGAAAPRHPAAPAPPLMAGADVPDIPRPGRKDDLNPVAPQVVSTVRRNGHISRGSRMILAMVASTSVSVSVPAGSVWRVLPLTRASSSQGGADGP
jgi:hypothetical protein